MRTIARKPLLRVTIRRRKAIFECRPDDAFLLEDLLSYQHPRADYISSVQSGDWDGMICLVRNGKAQVGLFHAYREEIEKLYRVKVTVEEEPPLAFRDLPAQTEERPYQKRAVAAMIDATVKLGGGIILSATGSGKTWLAGDYFRRLTGTGVFVVDELTLLEQARRELSKAIGEKVGIVGNSQYAPERITVATIQTLHKHRRKQAFRNWFRKVDVLLVDELHVQLNRRNLDVITRIRPRAVFGLTATLQLKKAHVRLPAMALAGPVIFEYGLEEGVKEGYLSKGRIVIVPFNDTLKGQAPGYKNAAGKKIAAGSPIAEYRRHICLNKSRNDLVEKYARLALAKGRKVFILVERVMHLRILEKRFADVKHYALSGQVDKEVRLEAMREMDAGQLNLVLATRVFGKGVDVRRVDCIIDATGKPSRNNALQRYGRGSRKTEGKKDLLYYDISDRNSTFAVAAWTRLRALRETGAPIIKLKKG